MYECDDIPPPLLMFVFIVAVGILPPAVAGAFIPRLGPLPPPTGPPIEAPIGFGLCVPSVGPPIAGPP